MKALITGANGFLGRHVVRAFLHAGHQARALVRPGGDAAPPAWDAEAELFHADLCIAENLAEAFEGIDILIHLAAQTRGDGARRIDLTLQGTERLLNAMAQSATGRLVHASSFAVYDWAKVGRVLTEQSPVLAEPSERLHDPYTVAKTRQEQLVRRMSERHGWALTVLRPAAVWGAGNLVLSEIGRRAGPVCVVVGPRSAMRMSYVENCADAFVRAAENPAAIGETFNIVDKQDVTVWCYAGECLRLSGAPVWRVPTPYRLGSATTALLGWINRVLLGNRITLPGLLSPLRFRSQFHAPHCPNDHAQHVLGWTPRYGYREALARARAEMQALLQSGPKEASHV